MRTIRIEEIRLSQLDDFARRLRELSGPDDILPISPQRVLAHIHNPCARPDDIVLLAAFKGDTCIGYHGLLPGLLRHDGTLSRVFWATTFYVSENHRGQGIGKLLIAKIKSLNIDFVVTGMTPAAEKAYLQSGLKILGPMVFYQLRLNKGTGSNVFDRILKRFLYRCWLFQQAGMADELDCSRVNQIDENLSKSEAYAGGEPAFYRDIDWVNWMLNCPWVVSKDVATSPGANYHFASVRDVFEYIALEFYSKQDNRVRGFVALSVSRKKDNTVLKIIDYQLDSSKTIETICAASLKYAARYLADRIDIPPELVPGFQNLFLQPYFMGRKKRSYLYHPHTTASPLAACADKIDLNYCDGDTAFT